MFLARTDVHDMPRRPAKYSEVKPQRYVRRDTGQAKPPADPVKQAFEQCWEQGTFGVGVSSHARAELFFRAGFAAGKASQVIEVVKELKRQKANAS